MAKVIGSFIASIVFLAICLNTTGTESAIAGVPAVFSGFVFLTSYLREVRSAR